ncbi:MAG: redoxin domain-containing protein [bacterium]
MKPYLLVLMLLFYPPGIALGQSTSSVEDAVHLAADSVRDSLLTCLEDAGQNSLELAGAVIHAQSERRGDVVWLIMNMEHLDRLEMTEEALLEHALYADSARRAFNYGIPQDMFRDYILAYRISTEPATAYRRVLFEYFAPRVSRSTTPADAAKVINNWISKNMKVISRGVLGPTQSPVLTFTSRSGTEEEVSILVIAILKSIGIPSRPARLRLLASEPGGSSWVEVYSLGGWHPLYPFRPDRFGDISFLEEKHRQNVTNVTSLSGFGTINITSRYTETGHLRLRFFDRGRAVSNFKHASVSVWNDGALRPLDHVDWRDVDEGGGGVVCELGEGTYVVTAGIRDHTGSPFIMMREVKVCPQETTLLDLDVSPRFFVEPADARAPAEGGRIPVFTLPDLRGETFSVSDFFSSYSTVIVLFNQHYEPSARMVSLLNTAFMQDTIPGPMLVGISQGESDMSQLEPFVQDLNLRFPVLVDKESLLSREFGVDEPFHLPVVLLIDERGVIRLLVKGYDPSACEAIERKLRPSGEDGG